MTPPEADPGGFGLLFVCTGNLYRSPIAERLLAARLGPRACGFAIGSAGTRALPGTVLTGPTALVIGELGGSAEEFASRRLTAELVAAADLVLGLAREHREAVVRLRPAALRRCFTLEEFVRLADGSDGGPRAAVVRAAAARGATAPAHDEDIADPDGRPVEELRHCAERIDRAVRGLAAILTVRQTV
jgi:protein-tyrosine phosphatase